MGGYIVVLCGLLSWICCGCFLGSGLFDYLVCIYPGICFSEDVMVSQVDSIASL